ncbi:hypothetical protein LEN26_016004 [Aphanomyces euteiches]|nr:hypothetical protein LEN26_016004 [Aphanomyces euteiches]KAH9127484.1 hypothetical protein AeMF1_002227 [Aphanomyces euteiches]KAH9188016.1 hypothetical protein AeNC1_010006 [Aphanomyces euteiches]
MEPNVILFGDFTVEETKAVLGKPKVQAPEPKKPFSWSNLSKPQTPPQQTAPPKATTATQPLEAAFEQALLQLDLHECARDLQRRGFINQGNTCFQNVTFQALLACAPFRNLLCTLSSTVDLPPTSPPAPPLAGWKQLLLLLRELEEPTLAQQMKQSNKKTAITLSPHFIRLFQTAHGQQEDALEFLEFLLDHLHTEYEQSPCTFPLSRGHSQLAAAAADDGWAEIKKNGKASVVHHNIVENESPVTYLFKGTLRSEIQAGRKLGKSTIEPFHCLHLNMSKSHATTTLMQMIHDTMADEVLEQHMIKRTTFETLPVVLSLHVKRFTYDPVQGPLKINTFVSYPLELELPPSLFSPALEKTKAKYKLFSGMSSPLPLVCESSPPAKVISHHGQYAVGGHYTAVCCDAKDQWTLYDDDNVIHVTKQAALEENAYLLFYLRV